MMKYGERVPRHNLQHSGRRVGICLMTKGRSVAAVAFAAAGGREILGFIGQRGGKETGASGMRSPIRGI